jgi:hypothetical protein
MKDISLDVLASDLGHVQADIVILQQKVYLGNGKSLESRVGALENYRESAGEGKSNMAMWLVAFSGIVTAICAFATYLKVSH